MRFQNALKTEIDELFTLPLLHTCDAHTLRSILETRKLVPQACDVFINSELLYTYYGVPSYRVNFDGATSNPAHFMVCLILKTSEFSNIHRVFPFDTGSFVKFKQIKETYFHQKTDVLDFELDNSINSAKKVIKTFYETNENYISKKPQHSVQFSPFDFEAIGYGELISDKTNNKFDDRKSSIEIIFDNALGLNKDTVRQLIIPNCFKDHLEIMALIKDTFGIDEPIGYDIVRGNPNEYLGVIRNEYLKFLKENAL